MGKVEKLKIAYKDSGFKGILLLTNDYKNRKSKSAPKCSWNIKDVAICDMAQFLNKFHYTFDLNNPKSFTEKIHSYKLLYSDDEMAKVVDKYEFKNWVEKRLGTDGFTSKAYGVWESVEDIERAWKDLPNEFVLKSTISSDGNNIIFVKDKESTSFHMIREQLEKAFDPKETQLNGFARAYYSLKPRVLAEQYIHEFDGSDNLKDYKFFCFNGKMEFVYTTARTFEGGDGNPSDADYPRTFFDSRWEKLPIALGNHPTADAADKPIHFNTMVEIAEKLSSPFPFARVDFYEMECGPLLGEITFYPTGGMKFITPIEFDKEIGQKLILPKERMCKL